MAGIQFDEEYTNPNFNKRENAKRGMVPWLIKMGIVKNEKMAQIILIGLSVLFFILSFIVGSNL
jgi:uncharacterized integral membrane protein